MKRLFLPFFVLSLLALCGVLLAGPSFIDWNQYKAKIRPHLETLSGHKIALNGDVEFAFFPVPHLVLHEASVSTKGDEPLLTFERAAAQLSIGPLLSGAIVLDKVELIKPVFYWRLDQDKAPSWISTEISTHLNQRKTTGQQAGSQPGVKMGIRDLMIEDGHFIYVDHKGDQKSLENIDVLLGAKSLTGPFSAKGGLVFSGQELDFDFYSEGFSSASPKSIPLNAQISLGKQNLTLSYNGLLELSPAFALQGEAVINAPGALGEGEPLFIKGLVSASAEGLQYKDMEISLGLDELAGRLELFRDPKRLLAYDLHLEGIKGSGVLDAQGGVAKDQAFEIEALSFSGLAGVELQAQGQIKDLPGFSGLDLQLAIATNEISKTANYFSLSLPQWLEKAPLIEAAFAISGEREKLALTANVRVMEADILFESETALNTESFLKTLFEGPGKLQLKHPDLAKLLSGISPNVNWPAGWNEKLDIYTDLYVGEDRLYKLKDLRGTFAGSSIDGTLDIDLSGDVPGIKGGIHLGTLSFLPAKQAPGNAKGNRVSQKEKAHWSREAFDLSGLHVLSLDLSVALDKLILESGKFTDVNTLLKLDQGVLNVEQFSAQVFGGNVSLDGVLKAERARQDPLTLDVTTQLRDVEMAQFLKAFSSKPVLKGHGKISLDAQLSTMGVSPAAFIYDLKGQGKLNGRDIVLEGFDLARFARAMSSESKPGDTINQLWGGATKGGQSRFDLMDGAFTIHEGLLNIDKLALDGPDAFIGTTGEVNLPLWTVKTDHEIILKGQDAPPPFSVKFKGPLDKPAQTFGQGALEDYLKRKLNRKLEKLLTDKLGIPKLTGPESNEEGEEPSQQPLTPEKAFQGLLRGLIQ